jgi:putative lipoic acid-binding regulatory protein
MNNINIQDINDEGNGDFYESFKEKLLSIEEFPSIYTFKFIVPSSAGNNEKIKEIFDHPSTDIQYKDSKTGKYNSLTVKTFVNTVDDVIAYYKKVAVIDKIIPVYINIFMSLAQLDFF